MADWDKELQKEAKESGELGDTCKATAFKLLRTSFRQSADDFNWWSSIGLFLNVLIFLEELQI